MRSWRRTQRAKRHSLVLDVDGTQLTCTRLFQGVCIQGPNWILNFSYPYAAFVTNTSPSIRGGHETTDIDLSHGDVTISARRDASGVNFVPPQASDISAPETT